MNTELIVYNVNNYIKLEINVYEISDEYLNIWLNALNTEYNIRNHNNLYLDNKKTIIYMDGIYISLGMININLLKEWKCIIQNEYNKRLYIKHEKLLNPDYTYISPNSSVNKDTSIFKSTGTQTEPLYNTNILNIYHTKEYENLPENIYDISQSTIEYLDKIESYIKSIN